ncbi:MAG: hypothetical protein ACO394_07535, partial [Blastocatellia bacterium]
RNRFRFQYPERKIVEVGRKRPPADASPSCDEVPEGRPVLCSPLSTRAAREACRLGSLGQGEVRRAPGRKEQSRVTMAAPELTEKLEGPMWKRDQPILGTPALANKKQAARAVEVGNPEMYSLLQAKPARVDDNQASAIDRMTNKAKDTPTSSGKRTTGSFFTRGGRMKSRRGISRERICR